MVSIYLDASVVIPPVQSQPDEKARLVARLSHYAGADAQIIISDLVCLECWVKPFAIDDHVLLAEFDAFFASPRLLCVGLTAEVCRRAAGIRASHRYRTPDALHLAAAMEADCDLFGTADRRLRSFPDIEVTVIGPH